MGQIFNRINRLIKAEINHSDSDPEKVLEEMIFCMQENLIQLRQAVAQAIATNKRTEQQYNQTQNEAIKWQRNAQLFLQEGSENLARQALERKKSFAETANVLKANLDKHCNQIDTLKRSKIALESKLSEANTKKNMLKARLSAAKAAEQLPPNVAERLGNSSARATTFLDKDGQPCTTRLFAGTDRSPKEGCPSLSGNSLGAVFARMEEKSLMQEARAQSATGWIGADLESQFAMLESGSGVDDELAALKAQMSLPPDTSQNPPSLPPASGLSGGSKSNQAVDSDLEQLKKQLEQL